MIYDFQITALETKKIFENRILVATTGIDIFEGIHVTLKLRESDGISHAVAGAPIEDCIHSGTILSHADYSELKLESDELKWLGELHAILEYFKEFAPYLTFESPEKPIITLVSKS